MKLLSQAIPFQYQAISTGVGWVWLARLEESDVLRWREARSHVGSDQQTSNPS